MRFRIFYLSLEVFANAQQVVGAIFSNKKVGPFSTPWRQVEFRRDVQTSLSGWLVLDVFFKYSPNCSVVDRLNALH